MTSFIFVAYCLIMIFFYFCEGVWDQDTELNLHTKNRWHMAKIEMDFRTGKADIQQINRFLSALIIGKPTDKKVDLYRKE